MTDLRDRSRGDNPALPEISPAFALRALWLREKFGLTGPYAKAICDLALGFPIDGGSHD